MSGGNIQFWGMVDAADGYDVVEWVAGQDWSNKKVGFAGNSWLAISQWYIAGDSASPSDCHCPMERPYRPVSI